jgi:hypothetical protein
MSEESAVFAEYRRLPVVEDEGGSSEGSIAAVQVRDSGELAEVEGFDALEQLGVVFLELLLVFGVPGVLAVTCHSRLQLVVESPLLSDARLAADDLVVDARQLLGQVFYVLSVLLDFVGQLFLLALELEVPLLQV